MPDETKALDTTASTDAAATTTSTAPVVPTPAVAATTLQTVLNNHSSTLAPDHEHQGVIAKLIKDVDEAYEWIKDHIESALGEDTTKGGADTNSGGTAT